jgi:hypothetical protein
MLLMVVGCGHGDDSTVSTGLSPSGSTGITTSTTTTATGMTTSATDTRVQVSGPIVCASPEQRDTIAFVRTDYGDEWDHTPGYRTDDWDLGWGARGLTVADFTGDGIKDVLVPRYEFPSEFLVGQGDGTFVNGTEAALGLGNGIHSYWGSSAADIDGDGDMDAFLYGMLGTGTQLINDGSGVFTWIERPDWDTGDSGYACGGAMAWADYDRDGDLDGYYGRLGGTDPNNNQDLFFCDSLLLDSDGAGSFTAKADLFSQEVQNIRIMAAGWDDFDGDGWLDLYSVSDAPPMANFLMLNDQNGGFTQPLGTGLEFIVAGMGLALGDMNGDEIADVMVPGIDELPFLLSAPQYGLLWVSSAAALNVVPDGYKQSIAWGGEFADMDNDGLQDIIETFGDFPGNSARSQPDEIHRDVGGIYEPVGIEWGFGDEEVTRGFIIADLNEDGWLDVVKRELEGSVIVQLANCGTSAWLEVRLRDLANHNHHAIGAKVRITAGDQVWTRRVQAGSTNYNSSGSPEVHFGLGQLDQVDLIEVEWPTGETTTHAGVGTRQILEISRE